jgi:integrase
MTAENLPLILETSLPAGPNRSPLNTLAARNDGEAIAAWLANFHDSPNTLINARKEVERLWLWATEVRLKAISALTHEDMLAYQAFLADPQPRERWVASAQYKRGHPDWRPFTQRDPQKPPLSLASQRQAMVILNGCFRWLIEAGYFLHNPLHLSRRNWRKSKVKQAAASEVSVDARATGRWLTQEEWEVIGAAIESLPRDTVRDMEYYSRCRWVMALLYLAKLRISEVATTSMGHFHSQVDQGIERWWLVVHGKGQSLRKVAVVPDLMSELVAYREACGLPPWPSPTEAHPLVGRLRKSGKHGDALSVSALHKIVKDVFRRATLHCMEAGNPGLGMRLESASAHWLRHTGASHLLHAGADVALVRDQLGHASIETTNTYVHSEELQRHDKISEHHKLRWDEET